MFSAVGEMVHAGQRYELGRCKTYLRPDGTVGWLDTFRSRCADCGAAFEFTTLSGAPRFEPVRRCQKHKKPGKRVKTVHPAAR